MAARRASTGLGATDPRVLAGIVASYVASHPRQPELSQGLDDLARYLGARGIRDVSRDELERSVLVHWSRLEWEKELRGREAGLFADHPDPRPVRRRHGQPFCPACGMFKDHRKECPRCGHLELTL